MTDTQTAGGAASPASALDRMITRAGRALVAWSARRERRRAERPAARSDVQKRADVLKRANVLKRTDVLKDTAGILDLDAPRAVRSFGFPPGIFR